MYFLTYFLTYRYLAEQVPEIDLVLGGHDHDFFYKSFKSSILLKSGTDFRELTYNKLKIIKFSPELNSSNVEYSSEFKNLSERVYHTTINKGNYKLIIETEYALVTKSVKEDETILKFVNLLEAKTEEKFKQVVGFLASPVDARFSMVRSGSIPINNFIADLVNIYMNTDCTIINSGTLRADSILSEGELSFGMLNRLLPGDHTLVRLKIKGNQLWKTLENGVSKYPALEGRFPIVSNIKFTFDPSKKYLKRIDPESIFIKGEKLDFEKYYTLSTRVYLHKGYDGYDELPNCENIDTSEMETIFDVCTKFFEIVRDIDENLGECLRKGAYGFEKTNKKLIELLRSVVVFDNSTPTIMLQSEDRIHLKN
jgi:5'-nucleotidase